MEKSKTLMLLLLAKYLEERITECDRSLREESFLQLKSEMKRNFSIFVEETLVAVCRSAFACDKFSQYPGTRKGSPYKDGKELFEKTQKSFRKELDSILKREIVPPYLYWIFTVEDLTSDEEGRNIKGPSFVDKVKLINILTYALDAPFQLFSGLMDVFYVSYRYVLSKDDYKLFMNKTVTLAFDNTIDKWFKYHSNYLFCHLEGISDYPVDPLVNSDKPGCLFGGRTRKFLFNKIKFYAKALEKEKSKITGFFYSIMDCKRSFPELLEVRRIESVMKHQKCLTGVQYSEDIKRHFGNKVRLADEYINQVIKVVPAVVRSVFTKKTVDFSTLKSPRLPTNNSCFESGRTTGGNLGLIYKHCSEFAKYFQGYVTINACSHPFPVYSSWDGTCYLNYIVNESNRLYDFNVRGLPGSVHEKVTLRKSEFYVNRHTPSTSTFPPINATVATVAEPMKFRIVTGGESSNYSIVRPLQKMLWTALSNSKPFVLTGKTISSKILNDTYCDRTHYAAKVRGVVFDYIAGDYSNATDNMHPAVRDAVWANICKSLGLDSFGPLGSYASWAELGQSTLGNHIIHNEELRLKYETSHGQLMGSPLSFIILCLANMSILYASYLLSKDRRDKVARQFRLEDDMNAFDYFVEKYGVLVNGDDLSLRVNNTKTRSFYSAWEDVSTSVGMSPSVGKNFISDNMVLVNSCPYTKFHNIRKGYDEFIACPRLNPGLVRGQGKVLSDSRKASVEEIDELLLSKKDQLDCVVGYLGESAVHNERLINNLFFFYNESLLKRTKRSWRLPIHLGGLGLPFGTVSKAAKMYANGIMEGKYTLEHISTPSFGMFEESKKIYRTIMSNFKDEQSIQSKYIASNSSGDFFWEIPNFDLLGNLDLYFGYYQEDIIDIDKFVPRFLKPDMGELKVYERFERDMRDAQSHPYLNYERPWDSMRNYFHVPGYVVNEVRPLTSKEKLNYERREIMRLEGIVNDVFDNRPSWEKNREEEDKLTEIWWEKLLKDMNLTPEEGELYLDEQIRINLEFRNSISACKKIEKEPIMFNGPDYFEYRLPQTYPELLVDVNFGVNRTEQRTETWLRLIDEHNAMVETTL